MKLAGFDPWLFKWKKACNLPFAFSSGRNLWLLLHIDPCSITRTSVFSPPHPRKNEECTEIVTGIVSMGF